MSLSFNTTVKAFYFEKMQQNKNLRASENDIL